MMAPTFAVGAIVPGSRLAVVSVSGPMHVLHSALSTLELFLSHTHHIGACIGGLHPIAAFTLQSPTEIQRSCSHSSPLSFTASTCPLLYSGNRMSHP
jgi:hypothetical protein